MTKYDNKILEFVYLRTASHHYLKLATTSRQGRFYDCMTAMLYAAFLIESYVNEIGDHLYTDWCDKYERLPIKRKLKEIRKALNAEIDLGEVPYCHITQIMEYRSLVAHSKAQYLTHEISEESSIDVSYNVPRSKMDELASLENATLFVNWAEDIVKSINLLMPIGDNAHPILRPDENPFAIASFGGTS